MLEIFRRGNPLIIALGTQQSLALQTLNSSFISFAAATQNSSTIFNVQKTPFPQAIRRIQTRIDNNSQASANDLTLNLSTADGTITSHVITFVAGIPADITVTTDLGTEVPINSELAYEILHVTDAGAVSMRGIMNYCLTDAF